MATSDKKILFGKEARTKLLEGCEIMYKSVGSTYSIAGRLVAIERRWNFPKSIADGVEVAREVSDTDPFITMGIDMIREAAEKQVVECGDGTSVTTILSYHMVKLALEMIDEGVAPYKLRQELVNTLEILNKELQKISVPSTKDKDIEHVATISSTSEEIGKLVSEAIKKVGDDGQLTVEESKTGQTYLEEIEGMSFDKGYLHPYFATNERAESVIHNPVVVVFPRKITLVAEISPVLEVMSRFSGEKSFLLVGDIGGDALRGILQNKMNGNINALAIDAPGSNERRRHFLEDIALVTGGQVLPEHVIGLDHQNFLNQYKTNNGQAWFGNAKTAIANKNTTTIVPMEIEDANNRDEKKQIERVKAAVATKTDALRAQLKNEESIFEREHLEERIAKLTTGVAVIKVGAKTEVEMREKIERVKDAIGAARSVSEGIVPGGGVSFLKISRALEGESTDGARLMAQALQQPIIKLMKNAGSDEKEIKASMAQMLKDPNLGYEVNSGTITDLVKEGVIDPTKVIRSAIENAVSAAGTIIMSDTLISISREKPNESGD